MPALSRVGAALREAEDTVTHWWLAPADPRAYAVVRIGYATAVLFVLLDLWPVRHALLSSSGLFGGADRAFPFPPNLFLWFRSEAAVTTVMAGGAAASVALALGVAPRLSAIAVYLWVLSYTLTSRIAASGFDTILRVLGFVLVVSPAVRTFGIGRGAAVAESPPAYGLRMIQWQVLLIYACTVWLKAPDPFWRNGEAVTYFLMSMFSRHPTPAFAGWAGPLALLTYGTLLVEMAVPFLLWMRRTRFFGVFLGASLHIGIALTSELALFSLTILPLYGAFFERSDFDRIASWFRRAPAGAVV